MAQPNQKELDKKEEIKLSLIKHLAGKGVMEDFKYGDTTVTEISRHIKLTDKQMCSIMRTSVRKSWMMSPVRILKLELARTADMNSKTRTKWLCACENCKGMFKMDDVEVDHIKGEYQLLTLADVEPFARSILDVSLTDLQIFCKPCHEIKTYAERHNMTFEEAKIEKTVILWQKTNNVTKQKEILSAEGFIDSEISNDKKRRDAYRHILIR